MNLTWSYIRVYDYGWVLLRGTLGVAGPVNLGCVSPLNLAGPWML